MEIEEIEYKILFHSDGTYTIELSADTFDAVIDIPTVVKMIESNLEVGRFIADIRTPCVEENGVLIFPKPSGISDELRLVACSAAIHPKGFPQDAIRDSLGIADSSRDAYINWDTKESSKYLSYNPDTKTVHISIEGIEWVHEKLVEKGIIIP